MEINPYASPPRTELDLQPHPRRPWGVWVVAFLYAAPGAVVALFVATVISLRPQEANHLLERGIGYLVAVVIALSLSVAGGVALFLGRKWGWHFCQTYSALNIIGLLSLWLRHRLQPEVGPIVVSALYATAAAYLFLPRPRLWIGLSGRSAICGFVIVAIVAAAIYFALGWIEAILNFVQD